MAKLEGVKTLVIENGETTSIEYNGEFYEKVADGTPDQIGDIVAGVLTLLSDEIYFFKVVGINDTEEHEGTGMFYDEDGDYNGMLRYDTFRKVDAAPVGATSGAKAGDTVEMTADCLYGDYHEGEQFVVKDDGYGGVYIDDNDGDARYINEHSHLKYKIVALAEENTDEEDAPMSAPLFAKVNRPNNEPIAGDYVEFDLSDYDKPYFMEGKLYKVNASLGGLLVIDEDGDSLRLYKDDRPIKSIYVKYTQSQAEQKAKVGDKVLIVDEDIIHSGYGNGDVVTVKHVDSDGDIHGVDTGFIAAEEFIVLTDVQVDDSEGEKETEEEYVPQEGDIVVITGNTNSSCNKVGDIGKVGELLKISGGTKANRVYVEGRESELFDCYTLHDEMRPATDEEKAKYHQEASEEAPKVKPGDYVVNHRGTVGIVDSVSHARAVGTWLYNEKDADTGLITYPASMNISTGGVNLASQEEIAKALGITDVAPGDKVEVIADDFFFAETGDTSEVVELDEDGVYTKDFYIAAFSDGKPRFKVVEKAAEKEEESKPSSKDDSPYGEISVGDTVKVVVAEGKEAENGWGRVNNGDIGVVTDADFLGSIRVDFPNQKNWCAEESELIKVADNGDLLPGTVVKGNISDKVITLGERDFDRDRSYGTAYLVKDNAPFWIGEEQFEILTKEEAKKHVDVAEEDFEAEELIPAVEIPIGTIVKVVQQGNGHYGETLRVTKNDGSGLFPYYTENLDGGFADVYDKEHLEVIEAPAQAEEKIEVGDLVKVIQSPAALPEGSHFIVRDVSHDGDIWSDSKSGGRYIYAPRHVELIAKADEVYA
ncbi:hypothetical protein [Oceanobacillus sojae]|uniref:hypothetical protein n=1 Tax=Oceanobacillus sojae TaxID=582851 RepID=UPI0036254FE7